MTLAHRFVDLEAVVDDDDEEDEDNDGVSAGVS